MDKTEEKYIYLIGLVSAIAERFRIESLYIENQLESQADMFQDAIMGVVKNNVTSRNIFSKRIQEALNNTIVRIPVTLSSGRQTNVLIKVRTEKEGINNIQHLIIPVSTPGGLVYATIARHDQARHNLLGQKQVKRVINKEKITEVLIVTAHAFDRAAERLHEPNERLSLCASIFSQMIRKKSSVPENHECTIFIESGALLGEYAFFVDDEDGSGLLILFMKTFISNTQLKADQLRYKEIHDRIAIEDQKPKSREIRASIEKHKRERKYHG